MSELKLELGQRALMIANEVVRISGSKLGTADPAYKRVESFSKLQEDACPSCWVVRNEDFRLEVTARTSEVNEYSCSNCGFSDVFPPLEADLGK